MQENEKKTQKIAISTWKQISFGKMHNSYTVSCALLFNRQIHGFFYFKVKIESLKTDRYWSILFVKLIFTYIHIRVLCISLYVNMNEIVSIVFGRHFNRTIYVERSTIILIKWDSYWNTNKVWIIGLEREDSNK